MLAWETALTTRDTNRVVRPVEWGFDFLAAAGGAEAQAAFGNGQLTDLEAMDLLSKGIAEWPESFFAYTTPRDFRLEQRHPELYPTNVRPETLSQQRELRRQAASGELRRAEFLRFTSAVTTGYPDNDQVNARWYPAEPKPLPDGRPGPRQAIVIMPQWNADAFSHNALAEIFNRFGVSCLRLSKPFHDVRRPAELQRSDYAVSSNVGRTIVACRQAVADVRSCVDWLQAQGYEHFGVLGTSLGSCYGFIAAAMDPRLQVCAFNHASLRFGDVVWTGQSTRHIRAAFEDAGLTQADVRAIFTAISPSVYMDRFAAERSRQTLVIHATWDLTFLEEFSQELLQEFRARRVDFRERTLPCGHYTTGEWPYKYLDGWFLGHFVWSAFKQLRQRSVGMDAA